MLAPEAHYEQFFSCWPSWAGDTLDGTAFTTPANRQDRTRNFPDGYGYPIGAARGLAAEVCTEHAIPRIFALPILDEGAYVGSLLLGRAEAGRFTEAELRIAR